MRSVRSLRARGKKAKLYETPGTQEKNIGKRWSGCVGYFAGEGTKSLYLRKPRVLQSISDCETDYAEDENDRRSVSGRIKTLGGMTTNWTSKKQHTASLSSSEAEHQALSEYTQEAVFNEELTGQKKT
jgi:hypothetical protein